MTTHPTLVIVLTLTLYGFIGHWAAVVPIGFSCLGLVVHFVWCRKNGIHPFRATPQKRYYQLRGWAWHEEAQQAGRQLPQPPNKSFQRILPHSLKLVSTAIRQ